MGGHGRLAHTRQGSCAQAALYATGQVAARLADGRIAAIALIARPGQPAGMLANEARAAVHGLPVRVLTSD